jgi:SAM-dependent methyltransferase
MKRVDTSEHLRRNYADYYRADESEWRRLGAVDKAADIVALCGHLRPCKVLEIGAGEGAVLRRLSELNFGEQLYGLEISSSGVEAVAAKKIERLVECRLFDGYDIPYGPDSFDIAILSHVVEHLEHPRLLLYEAARVAPYVFAEVPLEDTLRLSHDYVPDRVGHINFYSPKTIRRLLQSSGLRILEQLTVNPSKDIYRFRKGPRGAITYYVKQILLKMSPGLATLLLEYHSALLCERQEKPAATDSR